MPGRRQHPEGQADGSDRPAEPSAEAPPAPAGEPSGEAKPPCPPGEAAQALQAERDDLLARLQRVSADYLNYQKRVRKEIAQARQFANESLIKALLPVMDDLDRAIESVSAVCPPEDPLLIGARLVREKALHILGQFGLTVVEALGQPFDPDHHAAVTQEDSAEHPPGTVVRQMQKGYSLHGRAIRPAMVVVSRRPGEGQESSVEPEPPADEQAK